MLKGNKTPRLFFSTEVSIKSLLNLMYSFKKLTHTQVYRQVDLNVCLNLQNK